MACSLTKNRALEFRKRSFGEWRIPKVYAPILHFQFVMVHGLGH